jgi:hypothetical protein
MAATVLVAALHAAPRTAGFAAEPTVPGCFVVDRYGRTFNLYADQLGIAAGSLLLPDIGGVLLTTRLRVVDLAGLTEPRIARLRNERDWAGLRAYVLDDVRPTFVHLHRPWDPGLADDRRFRRDYVEIVSGDFVRRDAVRSDRLAALAPIAKRLARQNARGRTDAPLRGCGVLKVGDSPAAR